MRNENFILESIRDRMMERFSEEPEFAHLVSVVAKKMNTGFYRQEWIDVFMQYSWHHGRYTLEDAYIFSNLWAYISSKNICVARIRIGSEPFADKEIEQNQTILNRLSSINKSLSYMGNNDCPGEDRCTCANEQKPAHTKCLETSPFSAKFIGGLGDDDGSLSWNRSTLFTAGSSWNDQSEVEIKERQVPLEVGYTRSETTFKHIILETGVARWPYGSKWITILVPVAPEFFLIDYGE